jgi:hypothetical protein
MSRARFATVAFVGAGISLSAIAASRLIIHQTAPAAGVDHRAPENILACDFDQYLTFRQPIGSRPVASVVHPMEMIQCDGR